MISRHGIIAGHRRNQNPYPRLTIANSEWHYLLDEASGTRNDSGPSGLHLTDINTVGTATGKLASNCAHFVAASSEKLERANNAAQRWDGDGTFFAWVKLNSLSGSGTKGFAGMYNGGINDWIASYEATDARLRIYFERAGDNGLRKADTFGAPSSGVWYFYAVKKSGTTCYISVNGGAWDSDTMGTAANSGANGKFTLGALDAGYYLDCDLQQVCRFNFVATDAEVAYLYNSGAGRLLPAN